ncbi:MAG: hypothetical protein HY909_11255 [Deltaproteobacteria bacterium]|nr:hypothetical protein [Deltaproteobacteria bacterium]
MTLPVEERLRRFAWLEQSHRGTDDVPRVPPEFVVELGRSVLIIDTRQADDLLGHLGYIPGTTWVPLDEVDLVASRVPADTMTVLVSSRGTDAAVAVRRLESLGMTWVAALTGGVWGWRSLGYDTLRNPSVLATRGSVHPPKDPPPPSAERRLLKREDLEGHLGDPRSLRWVKLAAVLLRGTNSCVDGRDDHGVIGSPGGDAGEFLLALAALERLTGKPFDIARMHTLLRAWADAFGDFYMHTDVGAYNVFMKSMGADSRLASAVEGLLHPGAWRAFMQAPPKELRGAVLEHLAMAPHLGCGHLRLSAQNPEEYGLRGPLLGAFLRSFHSLRWEGAMEPQFVVLGGGHLEGAVVLVTLHGGVAPYTRVPLVSPAVHGTQFFVGHHQVMTYQRKMFARFLAARPEVSVTRAEARALPGAIDVLAERQLQSTLSRLAPGLPMYEARFHLDRSFRVRPL